MLQSMSLIVSNQRLLFILTPCTHIVSVYLYASVCVALKRRSGLYVYVLYICTCAYTDMYMLVCTFNVSGLDPPFFSLRLEKTIIENLPMTFLFFCFTFIQRTPLNLKNKTLSKVNSEMFLLPFKELIILIVNKQAANQNFKKFTELIT